MKTELYRVWLYRCALETGQTFFMTILARNEKEAILTARKACADVLRRIASVSLKETAEPINLWQ